MHTEKLTSARFSPESLLSAMAERQQAFNALAEPTSEPTSAKEYRLTGVATSEPTSAQIADVQRFERNFDPESIRTVRIQIKQPAEPKAEPIAEPVYTGKGKGKLLSIGSDAKTVKGVKIGILTGILYLTPQKAFNGKLNLCPFASIGCTLACLYTAGRGIMHSVNQARRAKTGYFLGDRKGFYSDLIKSVARVIARARKLGLRPAIRLNGTSDLGFEHMPDTRALMLSNPDVAFYDYTKSPVKMRAFLDGKAPANFHLTFSRSESNGALCREFLAQGGNVAAVFSVATYESVIASGEFNGFPVIDGDTSDARFLDDGKGVIIALKAKGKAKKDESGFVISTESAL